MKETFTDFTKADIEIAMIAATLLSGSMAHMDVLNQDELLNAVRMATRLVELTKESREGDTAT